MKKIDTGMLDDKGMKIFVGDILRSEWNYNVIVQVSDKGDFYGKLICPKNHSCANIPYALNNGNGYIVTKKH